VIGRAADAEERREPRAGEALTFSALRPNDGCQTFGPSLGSEIRLFTPKITKTPEKNLKFKQNDGSS